MDQADCSGFDWAPSEDSFRCGDLVRHLIQAEVFWRRLLVKGADGERYDPFGLEGDSESRLKAFRRPNLTASRDETFGSTAQECLDSWAGVQKKTEEQLATIPDESLHGVVMRHPLFELEAPIWDFLIAMLEHEAHHRGQLSAYLKMLGAPQPASVLE